jgi:ribosome-binding protein aMBF1 (putative translation factor)
MRTEIVVPKKATDRIPGHYVTRAEYNALRNMMEDIQDSLTVLAAQRRGNPGKDSWPSALVDRMLKGESLVRLWREHRGLTLARLSAATGVAKGYISEVESGKKPGSMAFFKKMAKALDVSLDDLTDD